MAKSLNAAEVENEAQISPRKIRPMPSRRSLRAKKPEEQIQLKDNNRQEEVVIEEEDIGRLKAPRTPRKLTSKSKTGKKAITTKKRTSKPLADAMDEDDIEDGDLGVVGRPRGVKRVQKDYDSDALDDDEDEETPPAKKRSSTKRKHNSTAESPTKKSPQKKRRRVVKAEDDEDEDFDLDLKEGQEVVGKVVQAPKTGRVIAGQISQNTLGFLIKLEDPACNDREWFKLHEPVYRLAEKEWKDFVEKFTDLLIEVDDQIPPLPPRDVIHRIYRDIRFSNDKTPYKRSFSASFSRSGRKGIFAHYHISIRPGGQSLIAGGSWCPGRNELATIRTNLMRNSQPLRDIISSPEFVEYFGEAKPQENGERSNIFGAEDELKVAPKGVNKEHKDIDLLKCRSFAVVHRFLDSEVLEPDFNQKLADVAVILQPFVHCLNNLMTLQQDDGEDEDEDG